MGEPDIAYLADHSLLLALPAFGPALVVVGVVVYVAMRDRRKTGDHPHRDRPVGRDEDEAS
jgi:hypothetical protein